MKQLIILIFICLSFTGKAQNPNNWLSFRGNSELKGCTYAEVPKAPKLLWTYKTGDAIKSSPIISNRNIFVGSNDGKLYAISKEGELKWTFDAETSVEAAPLYLDGNIYFGSLEGKFFCLNASSGEKKWEYTTEGQISGSASWFYSSEEKKKRLLFGSYDYFLHCVDAKTGKGLWKYESSNYINGAPACDGEIAVFGDRKSVV